jgi:uncharacterized protein
MPNDIEQNKALTEKFFDAMSKLDAASLAECITPDFVIETQGSCVLSGVRSGAEIQKIVGFMHSALPNGSKLTKQSMIAEGDRVAYQATGEATTADGKPYNNQYLFYIQIKDGKVCRLTEYLDSLLVENTLGDRYREWVKNSAG